MTAAKPEADKSDDLSTWWQSFYDDCPFDLLLESEDRDLDSTVAFLSRVLHLKPGDRIFDQCCGMGTLSLPLAERGMAIVGADLCERYIEAARGHAAKKKLDCRFEQADAFKFIAPDCDAAFNWWTSFGYAARDEENLAMIARAYDSLKAGGRFALDFPNMACTINGFATYQDRTNHFVKDGNPVTLTRRSSLDLNGGYLKQTWKYSFADGSSVERNSSVRLYLPHNLVDLFAKCGFGEIETYADTEGNPISLERDRCIVVGRKPA